MSGISQYKSGQIVSLTDGRTATIRFVGSTHFAAGDWIGVEFDDAGGKNDGSVQGQRYFDCEVGHGMFLRPQGVESVLQQPAAPAPKAKAKAAPAPASSRNSIAGRPAAATAAAGGKGLDPAARRRETMNNASPSPAPRGVGQAGHARTPSKLSNSTTTTTAAASTRTGASGAARAGSTVGAAAKRTAAPAAGRPSVTGARTTATTAAKPATSTTSATARPRPSVSSRTGLAGAAPGTRTSVASAGSRASIGSRPASVAVNGVRQPQQRDSVGGHPTGNASEEQEQEQDEATKVAGEAEQAEEQDEEEEPGEDEGGEKGGADEDPEQTPQPSKPPRPAAAKAPAERPRVVSSTRAAAATKTTTTTRATAAGRPSISGGASARQVQDLETKLQTLERRRDEDKEKLKNLEKLQTERNRFESIIQKLQKKYQPQQEELTELRKKQKETEDKLAELESSQAEHETDLEMAYLDKEMAEEVSEALRSELDGLKTKFEEVSLEVEVLRDENEELNKDISPEERNTAGYYQLQLRLQRTQEALVRLRDITQDTEMDLKSQLETLEKEIEELRSVKDKYEEAQEKLKQTDSVVEDLRAQLDSALGAEDMIEELTDKNMSLAEQIDGLKLAIQDLEDLKEVNDELEYNHVEAERQMMDELEFKDAVMAEQKHRMLQKDEKLADYEYTITKFRELVGSLQGDIQEMRASQHISEAEAEELNSRSRAMNDLNLRLQTSAAKTVVNSVDMELRRLEAQEAVEHLAIVQMFLPESFRSERDSVLAYLRFKRVAAKARLLHGSFKDKISGSTLATPAENAFTVCEILDRLVTLSSICDRFSNNISASTLDRFARYQGALYELDPVERGLNAYIDQLKKDEVKERNMAEELQRSISLLNHLSEVHIPEGDVEAYADAIIMQAALTQSHLENSATALSLTKNLIPVSEEGEAGEDDVLEQVRKQIDALIGHSRSTKVVAGKTLNSLTELKDRSMALKQAVSEEVFDQCHQNAQSIADLARRLGHALRKVHEIPPEDNDVSIRSSIRSALSEFAKGTETSDPSKPLAVFGSKLQAATTQLQNLAALSQDLSLAEEFERLPPPWIQRSEDLKNSSNISATAEAEIKRLKDDIQERAMQLRQRDQSLEEQSVKIELLESRTRDANAKANRITELQRTLEAGKAREKELTDAIEQKFREISRLTGERDHWQRTAHEAQPSPEAADEQAGKEKAVATAREMEVLKLEIAGLKGAVRVLREDNVRIRLAGPHDAHMAWLSVPLGHKAAAETERRRDKLRREGLDVCTLLLDAVVGATSIDLTRLPANKLEWRPAKEKPAWLLARQREKWAAWHAMRDGFIGDAAEELGIKVRGLRRPRFQDAMETVHV